MAMKFEASLIRETGVGMNQIQAQLANLTLQLQDMKKEKQEHDDLWCMWCCVGGHNKNTCSTFRNYFLSREPNPLSCARVPWCHICQLYGHRHENYSYMQNMVTKAKILYYSFCHSVGHKDKDYRAYNLL